ncbi:MAG: nucleotide exchange factor GrpE [Clostridiales bacterium]|nr:nucleotide exchange factor GrpE [Clostridiales bacterium]
MSSKKKAAENGSAEKKADGQTAEPVKAEEPKAQAEQAEEPKTEQAEPVEVKADDEAELLRKDLAAEKDRYLRLLAEYDNYRRRSARERESTVSDARADTITKFLPVYDNLARALAQETADEAYRRGVEMIMSQFLDVLKKLGAAPVDSLGQRFDPTLHNAIMHTEDPEKGEGEIVEEFQKGFKLGDKVIRFAMVKVAN